ncbi:MAG: GIY-YIG nuclease family protein [Candidatus Vogelbacteria bacterium]|nr:GIY-YIG nuclease family protein [Candidatus Vogelbacteria bacterium]
MKLLLLPHVERKKHLQSIINFPWKVYILKCSGKTLYTGITTDLKRRFQEHKNKKGGHYTSVRKILKIVYTEVHPDRSSASKREAEIKSWSRKKKLELITGNDRVIP